MVEALCKFSQCHSTISSGVLGTITGGRKVLGFLQPASSTLSFVPSLFSIKALLGSLCVRFKCLAPAPGRLATSGERVPLSGSSVGDTVCALCLLPVFSSWS